MIVLDTDIVVVARERYSTTVACVRRLLAAVPADVRIIVVRGGMSRRMVRQVASLSGGRVEVVGPRRHLAANVARRIGLGHCTARFVVFLDNDIEVSPGWLEPLVSTALREDAWVVSPLVLERSSRGVVVHEAGGRCHLEQRGDLTALVESHHYMHVPIDDVPSLSTGRVELFEFHTVLFDRARLVALGGPDARIVAQGEHLDLALRVAAAGGSVWLEPASHVTFDIPARLHTCDTVFFIGRWSRSWNEASRRRFCAVHGVTDPRDDYGTWAFADRHRPFAWLGIARPLRVVTFRRWTALGIAHKIDRLVGRHLAEAALRLAPRWRGGGMEQAE